MRRVIGALLLALHLSPLSAGETGEARFKSPGGCVISAEYLPPPSGGAVFINVHGLGSNRAEWKELQSRLSREGFGYLSIDLSCHGASTACAGGREDYRNFTAARWSSLSGDIIAAAEFLSSKKVPRKRIFYCGASVGANLSLKAAAEGSAPAGVILLSPGLSYAGVEAGKYIAAGVPMFLAASQNDPYAWSSAGELTAAAGLRGLKAAFYPGPGGHGAVMLSGKATALADRMIHWVRLLLAARPTR